MKSAGQLDVGEAGSIELEFLLKGLNALAGLHGGRTGHGADQGFLAEHGFALWRCHTWHGAVPSSERESILRVAACWRKPESWVCAARFEPRISLCCIRATRAGAALISVYPAGDKTARLNGADPPSLVRQALFFQKKAAFFLKKTILQSMQPIDQKILSRIYGRGRGWAFTKTDFVAGFGEANIHQALSTLARAGTIRRVCHGVYDYPRYSDLLGQTLSPEVDQVAQALARKFNWRIQPSGDAALNLLGLSTQVPARWEYLSDGPSREYELGSATLAFRKSALKDAGFKLRESGLLVQAMKALGRERVDEGMLARLRAWLPASRRAAVLADTRAATGWIYQFIKAICAEGA